MKKSKHKSLDFDQAFDQGNIEIDFSESIRTGGVSKIIKLPPITIPVWLALEIDKLSKLQANSRAAIIRQLLVQAIQARHKTRVE
ncbi:MAG: hypothetical protein HYS98_04265 [Deltaproteobacteria bacterium]|nr:hypothetical protein [Deltaproteobacteria bacterium]